MFAVLFRPALLIALRSLFERTRSATEAGRGHGRPTERAALPACREPLQPADHDPRGARAGCSPLRSRWPSRSQASTRVTRRILPGTGLLIGFDHSCDDDRAFQIVCAAFRARALARRGRRSRQLPPRHSRAHAPGNAETGAVRARGGGHRPLSAIAKDKNVAVSDRFLRARAPQRASLVAAPRQPAVERPRDHGRLLPDHQPVARLRGSDPPAGGLAVGSARLHHQRIDSLKPAR